MRLGKIEKQILKLCLQYHGSVPSSEKTRWLTPDLWRDELPHLLWDWKAYRLKGGNQMRPNNRQPVTYPTVDPKEYQTKQATLTRALQTLYAKGLIDCGNSVDAVELSIYSVPRAERMGIEPRTPMTEEELTKVFYPDFLGSNPFTNKGMGIKPRHGRNIKSIRLTDEGKAVTENR